MSVPEYADIPPYTSDDLFQVNINDLFMFLFKIAFNDDATPR
jgi:hypothetical protein